MRQFLFWLNTSLLILGLNSCQNTPSNPVQRLYNDNQNAQQVRAQQQAMQNGMDKYYAQPNQAAAQRTNANPILPSNR